MAGFARPGFAAGFYISQPSPTLADAVFPVAADDVVVRVKADDVVLV